MQKEQQILQILLDAGKPLTSHELAFQLGMSERTILKYLNILKEELVDSGAEIIVKQRYGSYISIYDNDMFVLFKKKFFSSSVLEDPTLRKMYVLMRLIVDGDYINIYELADEIAVSPSLLRSVIKELVPVIRKYHLKLDHNRLKGYRIIGDEHNIRTCLSREFHAFSVLNEMFLKQSFEQNEYDIIHEIISNALKQYNIAIARNGVDALTLHTLIAINRIETNNPIQLEERHEILVLKTKPDYYATCRINAALEEKLHISLPESELIYLTMHISGKQRIFGHEHLQVNVDEKTLQFYNNFLRNIYMFSGEDFFEDEELRTSLLNHIVPFLQRIQNGMLIEKTEMTDIKSAFPYAYDLAVTGLSMFEKENFRIPEAEISYFCLHLELSMEKRKEDKTMHYNVLVICNEVSNVYQLLSYKLNKSFSNCINEIVFTTEDDFNKIDLSDFQFFLSTVEPSSAFPDYTVYISKFINDEDIQRIDEAFKALGSRINENVILKEYLFMDIDADDKDTVLNSMVNRIAKYIPLPDDFMERVNIRESMATTELDNRVAIPHPISNQDLPGFVSIARLSKPCIWESKQVQLVFLVSGSNDINPWLYGKIARIISNSTLSKQLLEAKDFVEFVDIFEKI